jgi:hypothetical protein
MAEFVAWYDRGAFPDLVLENDEDGQEVVNRFKEVIEEGASLQDIREDRVLTME